MPAPPIAEPTTTQLEQQPQTQEQADESLTTCRYPSKKCWNARARKRNGELHNLCELHRQKANKNQRRLEQKRKASKKAAASAKRTRKSRAGAKSRTGTTARVTKLSRQQTATAIAASTLAATAKTLQVQRASLVAKTQTIVRQTASVAPTGFFTDLMLSETPLFTKQQPPQQLQQQQQSIVGWPVALESHHSLLHNQLQFTQMLRPASAAFEVDEFFDADTDVDSLVACLDANPISASSVSALLAPPPSVVGSSSPIDVCDGLDAIAAVSDFRWHPIVVASAELYHDPPIDELC